MPRVGRGFGHAEAHVRPCIRRRIADHGDAPVYDRRRGEVVDRRNKQLLDRHQRVEQRRRQDRARFLVQLGDEILADQWRRHRIFVLHAVLVDIHVAQGGGVGDAVPDEVEAPLARREVVVKACDRIGDHFLPRRQKEGEVRIDLAPRPLRQIGLVGSAAPNVVAGVDRLHLRGHLAAHARTNAVAANQDVGVFDAAVGERHAHAALVLVDTLEIPAEMVVRGIDGGAQQALQPVPRAEDLAQWPLLGDAAVAVDGDALGYLDAEPLGAGAARLERVEQFGMAGDASAAADQLDLRALVDVDLPADLAQEGGAEQS